MKSNGQIIEIAKIGTENTPYIFSHICVFDTIKEAKKTEATDYILVKDLPVLDWNQVYIPKETNYPDASKKACSKLKRLYKKHNPVMIENYGPGPYVIQFENGSFIRNYSGYADLYCGKGMYTTEVTKARLYNSVSGAKAMIRDLTKKVKIVSLLELVQAVK